MIGRLTVLVVALLSGACRSAPPEISEPGIEQQRPQQQNSAPVGADYTLVNLLNILSDGTFSPAQLQSSLNLSFSKRYLPGDGSEYVLEHTSSTQPISRVASLYLSGNKHAFTEFDIASAYTSGERCLRFSTFVQLLISKGWYKSESIRAYGVFRDGFRRGETGLYANLEPDRDHSDWCISTLTISSEK